MDFDATLDLDGKTATGITVPATVIDQLGGGKRPAVLVTINGATFPTTIGSMKGACKIPVSAANRELIQATAGDLLRVSVTLDSAPTELEVPGEFADALATDQQASDFFASLTASQKRGFIVSIETAKTATTRTRRVAKAMVALRDRQKRP